MAQRLDPLEEKILNTIKEENLIEESFKNNTEEEIRKEKIRKENRLDESNFETLD